MSPLVVCQVPISGEALVALVALVGSLFRVGANVVICSRRSSHNLAAKLALITFRHFVRELRNLALSLHLLALKDLKHQPNIRL